MHHWITSELCEKSLGLEMHGSLPLLQKVCHLFALGSRPESPHVGCCQLQTGEWCQREILWCIWGFPRHCRWKWNALFSAQTGLSSCMMMLALVLLELYHQRRHDEDCLFLGCKWCYPWSVGSLAKYKDDHKMTSSGHHFSLDLDQNSTPTFDLILPGFVIKVFFFFLLSFLFFSPL